MSFFNYKRVFNSVSFFLFFLFFVESLYNNYMNPWKKKIGPKKYLF